MELLLDRAKKQGKAKKRSFLRKHIVQLGGHVVASVSRSIVHRATKGPIFPNFSVRNELFYKLMLELMDKHYLLSWQEWRHLMPMQPIPRWHLRRTKVVLKNGLKTEFITYVPRRRHLRSKKHNGKKNTDADDNHSATGSARESDMFYGDAEDFDDSQGARPDSSGHKLDNTTTDHNHGSSATVTGQIVNGAAEGNHRGVKDIGFDTPTIIYFHGGGFCFGSVPVYRRWLWNFSRKLGGIRFFAVDYSLAPEAPFPIALKQALDSYLWLTDPDGGGVSPQNVIMGGDSAGGNLVGALLMLIRQMRLEKEFEIMHGTSSKTHTSIKKTKGRPTVERDAEPAKAMDKGKGKEVNEPEQMVDETNKQEQERLQDEGELEFDDEDEEEAEKERQLHRQLGVRRQSMADFKSSAERARQRVTKEKQATAQHNRKARSAEGRRVKRKEKVDTPSQTTDDDDYEEALRRDGDYVDRDALEGRDEAARLPTLKAIGFDMELVRQHRIPFELDEDQTGKYPSMPLAAMQISPWVDVSENSSVHSPDSWGHMTFRPYNISVRFALAYLGLEATDPPAAKKKEKQTRREWNGIVKLFHQRRQRRLQSKSMKQHGSTQATVAVPQSSTTTPQRPIYGHSQQPPVIYVHEPAAELLTPTQIWRDRLRRSNSVLSSTNLLAKSAASSATEVAECQIAIGERRCEEGSVEVKVDDHTANAEANAEAGAAGRLVGPANAVEAIRQKYQQEPDTFDICSPYISPVYGDMRGFPPLLISAGDVEPLLGDIMKYYHKAVDAGIEAEMDLGKNMNHDYQFFFSAVAMSDPEIPRFWGVARSWVHRQLQREIQTSTPTTATSSPVPSQHPQPRVMSTTGTSGEKKRKRIYF